MSEPVTNSEIEDVLSSIRRLVSEEPSLRAKPKDEESAQVERLVLTPAFRVPDDDGFNETADAPEAEVGSVEVTEISEPEVVEQLPEPDATVAEQEAATALQDEDVSFVAEPQIAAEFEATEEWHDPKLNGAAAPANTAEPERVEPAVDPDIDGAFELTASAMVEESPLEPETNAAAEFVSDNPEFEREAEAEAGSAQVEDMSLEARIAELEAAIQSGAQEWEPDGSEQVLDDETRPLSADIEPAEHAHLEVVPHRDEDVASAEAIQDSTQDDAELATEFVAVDDADPAIDAMEVEASEPLEASDENPIPEIEATLSVEVAATDPEAEPREIPQLAEVEEIEPEPEPEPELTVPEDVISMVEVDQPDHVDDAPEVSEKFETLVEDSVSDLDTEFVAAAAFVDDEDIGNILGEESATIDEDTLRDMISDLVRQELQGALGERITRNVRRLVRREIQRALSVRDLE